MEIKLGDGWANDDYFNAMQLAWDEDAEYEHVMSQDLKYMDFSITINGVRLDLKVDHYELMVDASAGALKAFADELRTIANGNS